MGSKIRKQKNQQLNMMPGIFKIKRTIQREAVDAEIDLFICREINTVF